MNAIELDSIAIFAKRSPAGTVRISTTDNQTIMALSIVFGGEMIRYNPGNGRIEFSNNNGRTWSVRYSGGTIGSVRCLMAYGTELLACSEKGVLFSSNRGITWGVRSVSHKDFVEMMDAGNEIVATTQDGHIYFSTNKGVTWGRRR